jgi:hypothetical protein
MNARSAVTPFPNELSSLVKLGSAILRRKL